jgi:putative membrane protein
MFSSLEVAMRNGVKIAIIVAGITIAVFVAVPLIIEFLGGWDNYRFGMMGNGRFLWYLPLIMVFVWGLIIWGVISIYRGWNGYSRSPSENSDSALEILKKRYARGEINKEEFEEKKMALS